MDTALPENKLLKTMCDAARRAADETCPHHPETRAEYYCNTCDVITCDKCALIGGHRGHDICELAAAAATCRAGLQRVQAAHREQEQAAAAVHARIDATYNGLKTRVDETTRAVIEAVKKRGALVKQNLQDRQLAEHDTASASLRALKPLHKEVEGKLAALPRLDGQAAALRASEQGLQIFQAPVWGKEQIDDAFRRFEALEPFKAIEEAAQGAFKAKPEFQIFVRVNGGTTQNKTVTIKVADKTTVGELKGTLVERTGVPRGRQGLVFQGKVLEDAGRWRTTRSAARRPSRCASSSAKGADVTPAEEIYVKYQDGRTEKIDVHCLDTLLRKRKIAVQTAVRDDETAAPHLRRQGAPRTRRHSRTAQAATRTLCTSSSAAQTRPRDACPVGRQRARRRRAWRRAARGGGGRGGGGRPQRRARTRPPGVVPCISPLGGRQTRSWRPTTRRPPRSIAPKRASFRLVKTSPA